MVPSVELTGEAQLGITVNDFHARTVAALPVEVMLGRRDPPYAAACPALHKYVDLKKVMKVVPPEVDWYTAAAEAIVRMYVNNRLGCCVISGKAHSLGGWSANDPDSGGIVLATDDEIVSQYHAICGPGDNGCYIARVLDTMKTTGFTAGGKKYYIEGYASVDWKSKELVQVAIALFGPCTIGIDLPSAWTNSAIWDVNNTRIVGGHDVSPFGYGKPKVISTTTEGVVISSWGRLYLITWAAFTSSKWLSEMYVMLPKDLWTGIDQKAPSGIGLADLRTDLTIFQGGNVPPIPDNPPPPPPPPPLPPPPPPVAKFPQYRGTVQIPYLGSAPVVLDPVAQQLTLAGFDLGNWKQVAKDVGKLLQDLGSDNYPSLMGDVIAVLKDFGVTLFGQAGSRGINVWGLLKILPLLRKLVDDYRAKDWTAIAEDVIQIAVLLGINLSSEQQEGLKKAFYGGQFQGMVMETT